MFLPVLLSIVGPSGQKSAQQTPLEISPNCDDGDEVKTKLNGDSGKACERDTETEVKESLLENGEVSRGTLVISS